MGIYNSDDTGDSINNPTPAGMEGFVPLHPQADAAVLNDPRFASMIKRDPNWGQAGSPYEYYISQEGATAAQQAGVMPTFHRGGGGGLNQFLTRAPAYGAAVLTGMGLVGAAGYGALAGEGLAGASAAEVPASAYGVYEGAPEAFVGASPGPAGYALEDVAMSPVDPSAVPARNLGMTPPPTGTAPPGVYGPVATGTVGSTALGRLLKLDQTGQDALSVGGSLLPIGLGIWGANRTEDAYRDVVNQFLARSAPSLRRFEESFEPGFDLFKPGTPYASALERGAEASARAANVKYGNPYDAAPYYQVLSDVTRDITLPTMANYRGINLQGAGMGLNTAGSAAISGAGTAGGIPNAIGYGANQLFRPPDPLDEALRRYAITVGGARI